MGLLSAEIPTKKMVPLCRQMATSYDAGIPVLRMLDMLSNGQKDRQVRDLLRRMSNAVQRGSTLGDAAQAESKYLPKFFISLLSTGEMGGRLDEMLRDLAQYFEDRLTMQRNIVRSLIYPCIQIMAAWYLGTFALRLIPKIMNLMTARGGGSFDIGAYFVEYGIFQAKAHAIFAIFFVAFVVLARMGLFGWVWGLFATHIWPLSNVTIKFGLARFFRSMSLLIGAGLRVDFCVDASAEVTANPYMEKDLKKATPLIRRGSTLVEAFSESRYLTPTAREMVAVGEQSGNLETQLRKVADLHLADALHAVDIATKFMGVLIVLAVAGLIGYIVILFWTSLYGGLFNELGV
jgi:type II secretory pathway component PulF